jgi:hypothetical protein
MSNLQNSSYGTIKQTTNFDEETVDQSNSEMDEFSSKLPVTELYGAPRRGADSNLHWYKMYFIPF